MLEFVLDGIVLYTRCDGLIRSDFHQGVTTVAADDFECTCWRSPASAIGEDPDVGSGWISPLWKAEWVSSRRS